MIQQRKTKTLTEHLLCLLKASLIVFTLIITSTFAQNTIKVRPSMFWWTAGSGVIYATEGESYAGVTALQGAVPPPQYLTINYSGNFPCGLPNIAYGLAPFNYSVYGYLQLNGANIDIITDSSLLTGSQDFMVSAINNVPVLYCETETQTAVPGHDGTACGGTIDYCQLTPPIAYLLPGCPDGFTEKTTSVIAASARLNNINPTAVPNLDLYCQGPLPPAPCDCQSGGDGNLTPFVPSESGGAGSNVGSIFSVGLQKTTFAGEFTLIPELSVVSLQESYIETNPNSGLGFDATYRSDVKGFVNHYEAQVVGLGSTSGQCFNLPIRGTLHCFEPYAPDGGTSATLMLQMPSGRQSVFDITNPAAVVPIGISNFQQLKKVGANWVITDYSRNTIQQFDASGNLLLSQDPATSLTQSITLSDASTPENVASRPGLPISINDSFGRQLSMSYDASGRLSHIVDPDGGSINFGYGTLDLSFTHLCNRANCIDPTTVTFQDGSVKQYIWDDRSTLSGKSGTISGSGLLSGVVDESGNRFQTATYQDGFAQSVASGTALVGSYSLQNSLPQSGQVSMQIPSGAVVHAGFTTVNDAFVLEGADQPAFAERPLKNETFRLDALANASEWDKFDGGRECFAYDVQGRESTHLEGLTKYNYNSCPSDIKNFVPVESDSSVPQRKTSTQWHPLWLIRTRIAEPGKITTWVYNGQTDPIAGDNAAVSCTVSPLVLINGDPTNLLCRKYEQATSDATGALGFNAQVVGATRRWTYTYNQAGQLLTETSPKLSATDILQHTSQYTYYTATSFVGDVGHRVGDLQSVSNPLGQTTNYLSYDKSGRVLSERDPNGVVISRAYTPRGKLQNVSSVGTDGSSSVTSFTYWPTGLMKTATLPDGATSTFSYDTAHRLTDILDQAGNRMHYELDASGNRTAEQVTDASGNLGGAVVKAFDNLNRLQSFSGTR